MRDPINIFENSLRQFTFFIKNILKIALFFGIILGFVVGISLGSIFSAVAEYLKSSTTTFKLNRSEEFSSRDNKLFIGTTYEEDSPAEKIQFPKSDVSAETHFSPNLCSVHIVSAGETLGQIARDYGANTGEIIQLNNLEPPYRLTPEMELLISCSPKTN